MGGFGLMGAYPLFASISDTPWPMPLAPPVVRCQLRAMGWLGEMDRLPVTYAVLADILSQEREIAKQTCFDRRAEIQYRPHVPSRRCTYLFVLLLFKEGQAQ